MMARPNEREVRRVFVGHPVHDTTQDEMPAKADATVDQVRSLAVIEIWR